LILKRVVLFACGVAALAAAAFTCVVALAFALYAGLKGVVGPAWASAGVAGACLLLILALALGLMLAARPPKKKPGEDKDMLGRLVDLAREKPIVAASAILAAAMVAWKNPKVTAAIVTAMTATQPRTPPKK
jgi:hypothetical protein